jgi:hypothetical protein
METPVERLEDIPLPKKAKGIKGNKLACYLFHR